MHTSEAAERAGQGAPVAASGQAGPSGRPGPSAQAAAPAPRRGRGLLVLLLLLAAGLGGWAGRDRLGLVPAREAAPARPAAAPGAPAPAASAPAPGPDAAAKGTVAAPDPAAPRLDLLRVGPGGDVTVAGRAAPAARVRLRIGGVVVAETEADAAGDFAALFDIAPAEAPRPVEVESEDAAGLHRGESALIVAPRSAEDIAALAAEGGRTGPLYDATGRAETGAQGAGEAAPAPEPEARPGSAAPAADPAPLLLEAGPDGVTVAAAAPQETLGLDAISYPPSGGVLLAGRGAAGLTLRAYLDGALAGEAAAGSDAWSLPLAGVGPGDYTLRIDAVDGDGRVQRRIETPFRRESHEVLAEARAGIAAEMSAEGAQATPAEAAARLAEVTVQPGNTLWGIATGTWGDGMLYARLFDANRAQIRNPDLIYPGQVFTIPQ